MNEWISHVRKHTTSAFVSGVHVSLNAEVASLSPSFAPGVLDKPVVDIEIVIVTISDRKDSMVMFNAAVISRDHTL